jgi:hypothetical protein
MCAIQVQEKSVILKENPKLSRKIKLYYLGPVGKEAATFQTGSHQFVLISVQPAKFCFVCKA